MFNGLGSLAGTTSKAHSQRILRGCDASPADAPLASLFSYNAKVLTQHNNAVQTHRAYTESHTSVTLGLQIHFHTCNIILTAQTSSLWAADAGSRRQAAAEAAGRRLRKVTHVWG